MSLFSLATAQVTIEVLDRAYHASMRAVEARWTRMTRMMAQTPALGGLGKAAAGLMQIMGGLAKVASVIPTAFFAMGKAGVSAMQAIGKVAGPVVGAGFAVMLAGVRAVAAALPSLGKVAAATFVNLKGAWSTISSVIGGSRIGQALNNNLVKPVRDSFAFVFRSIAGSRIGRAVAGAFGAAVPQIKGAISTIASATGGIFKGIGANLGGAGSAIGSVVGSGLSGIGGAVGGVAKAISSAFGPVISTVASGFGTAIKGVGKVFAGLAKTAVSVLGAAAKTVGGLFSSALGAVGGLAGGALKFGGMALGALGLAGGLSLAGIAAEAATAEGRLVNLQRVLGGDAEATATLARRFNALGSTMGGIDLGEVYRIADVGARLGIAGNELGLFTTDMAKMSTVLAEIPVEEAATRISRILAVFQKGTKDAGRMASALNALDMASTATGRDILDITSRLSGTSSVLGMTPQKALALSTALRQAGVPIETAGTSITQILGRMASKKDAGQFAKVAGLDKASWERMLVKDPLEAIVAFERGLSRLDTIAQVRALDKLHMDGQRVRSTLLQLGRVLPQLTEYVKIAESEWESMSSIQKGHAMVADMLGNKYKLLVNNFELMIQALGAGMMPMFKAGADALIFLFRDLTRFFEDNGGVVSRWAARIGDALAIVGVLFRSRGKLWEYVVVTMTEKWEQFSEVVSRVWTGLGANLKWAIMSSLQVAMNLFTGFAAFLTDLFQQLGDQIGATLYNAWQKNAPAWMGGGGKPLPVPAVKPNMKLFGDPFAGVGAAPGFPNLMAGLPDRQQQLAGIAGGIQQDMARGVFERQQQVRQMDLQDENARREQQGLPPLTRKQAEQLRRRKLRERTRAAAQPMSVMRATQATARRRAAAMEKSARIRADREARKRALRIRTGRANLGDIRSVLTGGAGKAGRNVDFGNLPMDVSLPEGREKIAQDLKPALDSLNESARLLVEFARRQPFVAMWE
jgi:TP901 family phage tail tape measure protein